MRTDKELLKILTFATFGAFALERAIFYIFLTEHHYTPSTISLLQALFFVSIFLFEIPTGIFGDYFGKRLAIAVGVALRAASLIFQFYCVDSFWKVLIAFFLYALSLSFVSGSLTALLFEHLKSQGQQTDFSRRLALMKLAEGLSLAAAMALGPLVKNLLDWEGVFFLSSLASFLALLAILTFNPHDHVTPHAIAETTRPRTMSFFSASQHTMRAAMPVSLMHACMTPVFINAQLLFQELGADLKNIGYSLSVIELIAVIFVFSQAKRLPPLSNRILVLLMLLFIGCGLLNGLWSFSLSCIAITGMNMITTYFLIGLESYVNHCTKDDNVRATTLSTVVFLDMICIALGYAVFGQLCQRFSISTSLVCLTAFPVVGIIMVILQRNRVNYAVEP